MADLQKPTPAKRGLPFKRTVKQKAPSDASSAVDDDGLALFSQSKAYFPTVIEDQQKRAREKAEKEEQERKEKLEREREKKERKARDAQLGRERRRRELQDEMKEKESAKKRRKYSLDSDDEKPKYNEDEDDDDFTDKPSRSHRQSSPLSLGSGRDPSASRSSRALETTRKTCAASRAEPDVVLLESSDDEDGPKVESSASSKTRSKTRSGSSQVEPARVDLKGKGIAEDSDSDLEMLEDKKENKEGADKGEEDPSEFYIKAAMERRRKAEEARRARGTSAVGDGDKNSSNTPGFDDDERGAPVSVMIAAPTLPDAKALCCTVRTAQALQIAFDTYKERLKIQTDYPHKTVSELVFTWRGDRVYNTTKLETLGICPRGDDGRLHDKTKSGRDAPEGYVGKDKVYFEAWTPEEYEENQQKRERERKRREMGEWWDEDDTANDNDGGNADDGGAAEAEAESPPKEDDRVRVIFKAKNMPSRNVTLRKYSTVAHMIKAFRKLAGIGEDKHVEIRWDGEALDAETTVEEADIGDMDSVEVHIR